MTIASNTGGAGRNVGGFVIGRFWGLNSVASGLRDFESIVCAMLVARDIERIRMECENSHSNFEFVLRSMRGIAIGGSRMEQVGEYMFYK